MKNVTHSPLPDFPITIRQFTRGNAKGLYGLMGFVIFGFIFLSALLTAPGAAVVAVLAMLIVACAYVYLTTLNKRIILTNDGVIYKAPLSTFSFSYKDIEKVGFFSRYRRSTPSSSGLILLRHTVTVREAKIFLKDNSQPITIDLHFFSDENQLLMLETIARQAPTALYGENIVEVLRTKTFPAAASLNWQVDDTRYVPIDNVK